MAEDAELVGGISVNLGANDARLIGDLAEAEKLVQQWAAQAAEVQLGARFVGGAGGAPGGGGADLATMTKAIEQAFTNVTLRQPTRTQQAQPTRTVFGQGAATAATAQQGQTNLQKAIADKLAETGEMYDEQTGEVKKIGAVLDGQREEMAATTRATRQMFAVQEDNPSLDITALQSKITTLSGALDSLLGRLTAFTEALPMPRPQTTEEPRPAARQAPVPVSPTAAPTPVRVEEAVRVEAAAEPVKVETERPTAARVEEEARATQQATQAAPVQGIESPVQQLQDELGALNERYPLGRTIGFEPTSSTLGYLHNAGVIQGDPERTMESISDPVRRQAYVERNASLGLPGQAGERDHVGAGSVASTTAHEYGHAVHQFLGQQGLDRDVDRVTRAVVKDPPSGRSLDKGYLSGRKRAEAFAEAFAAVRAGEPDRWGIQPLLDTVFPQQAQVEAEAAPQPVAAAGAAPPRRPPRRTRAAAPPPEEGDEESTGRPYGPPLQIVDRLERQRRQTREVTGQSPLEISRSEASLFAQRQKEEAAAASRVSVPPPPPKRDRPISRVEYFAHTTPEERESVQTAVAEHGLQPGRPRAALDLEEQVRVRREATDAAEAEREVRRSAAPQRSTVALAQEQATRERGPKTLEQLQEEQRVAVEADEATPRSARPTPVPRTRSNMTPEEIARDERFRRDQAFAEQANAPRPRAPRQPPPLSANQAADEEVIARVRGVASSPEAREQRIQEDVARQQANVAAAASTGRTSASRIAAFRLGTAGRRAEADVRVADARREVTAAERAALPVQRRIAEYNDEISLSSAEQAVSLRQQREAFKALPDVAPVLKRAADAQEGLTSATKEYDKLQSGGNIVRNLSAIALGSFAFSAALKAVDIAVSAITPSLGSFIDEQLGFASTSTRVTSALAAQTLAMHGNVEATLAQAEAQAGLSQGAAETLNAQLRLTTQVKAGALAQQQASDLFRAGAGTGQGAPQGLYGGFGGIGGSSLLAGQIGGGKGFTEQISGDINALGRQPEKSPLEDLNTGLSYITNPAVKTAVNAAADEQGNGLPDNLGAIGRILPPTALINAIGDVTSGKNPIEEMNRQFDFSSGKTPPATPQSTAEEAAAAKTAADRTALVTAYLDDLGAAAERGAPFVAKAAEVTYVLTQNVEDLAKGAAAAAAAGDAYGYALATQSNIIVKANGKVVQSAEEYRQAVEQTAIGRGRTDPATLAAQFNVSDQALVGQLGRTQQYQLQTQMPAQAALQNLAAPPTPVGTGIVAANAGEQERITKGQERSIVLQRQLDDYYAQGREELENTYKPAIVQAFGAAAGQAFSDNLSGIQALGKEIAGIQASISNEQAAYATAQYNQQLFIARRTLSDINGLTNRNFGGAGQSYLGQLEKENLALGRQGQMLQFAMSQRQINYQTALAGFQAPGVTPAERQANIKEAQIEAGFAQKQLDIQRQMFGNQVEIVDISNLRQGVDLARQIGLLVQGRQVTIDVAVKQEQLIRAQQRSEQLVKQAGTYLTAVDTLAGTAISHIQEMETAAGKALSRVEVQAVKLVNKYFADLYGVFNASFRGTPPAGSSSPVGQGGGGRGGARHGGTGATGMLGSTKGTTDITIGEAGEETVAVLRNPRAYLGGGGGGGVTIGSIFSGPVTVRSDSDITRLAREVQKVIGREASLRGLRATSG